MKGIRLGRPSPAMVVAMIALFVALGGSGYAALRLPKNSVGSQQIKNNAITGAKVKNGSLTGKDIKLGALGTVPSAANANNANHASSADNAGHAGSADTAKSADALSYEKTFDFTIGQNGPSGTDFLTIGPFTLTALCDINNGGTDTAELDLRSTEDHSALDGGPETNDMTPANTKFPFRTSSTSTGNTNIEYSSSTSGALAPDGTSFWGIFAVHVNPPGHIGKCRFQGRYMTGS